MVIFNTAHVVAAWACVHPDRAPTFAWGFFNVCVSVDTNGVCDCCCLLRWCFWSVGCLFVRHRLCCVVCGFTDCLFVLLLISGYRLLFVGSLMRLVGSLTAVSGAGLTGFNSDERETKNKAKFVC